MKYRKTTHKKFNKGGQLVSKELLEYISKHYYVGYHASERLKERGQDITDITKVILNPTLAYYNTDGSINLGVDDYRYFVIIKEGQNYKIITFKETRIEPRVSIYERRELALKGIDRRPYYGTGAKGVA